MSETKEYTLETAEFYKEFMTGDKKIIYEALVASVSIQEIIDQNEDLSYLINEKYYAYGVLDFDISIEFEFDAEIIGKKMVFKSDGIEVGKRKIQKEDIVDIFLQVAVPVNFEKEEDSEKSKNFFMLDMNPTQGHYYSSADVNGFAEIPLIDREYEGVNRERKSNELLAKNLTLYLIPQQIRRVTDHVVIGGTQRDNVAAHTDRQGFFDQEHPEYDPTLLPLAILSSQSPFSSDDIITLDTRKRGGGIKSHVSLDEIKKMDVKSTFNWDIGFFDGEAYQENGVFVLRVPETRFIGMDDERRELEKKRIEKAVDKFKAFGIMPIIEYFEEGTVAYGEILRNPEFDDPDNPHIGYYNQSLSSGDYKIEYRDLDAGDNMVLTMVDDAVYAISIPGFRFDIDKNYTIQVKVMKEDSDTTTRPIGTITYIYSDGSTEEKIMKNATSLNWQRIDEPLVIKEDLQEVLVEINKSDMPIYGTIFIDYISVKEVEIESDQDRETIIIENI